MNHEKLDTHTRYGMPAFCLSLQIIPLSGVNKSVDGSHQRPR